MSHNATNWAIRQRKITPIAKLVLWHLCDRFNPDYGCFVSQVRLAEDCEVSRSQLNVTLAALEAAGLVRRFRRRDEGGRRQSTVYQFPFEEGLDRFPPLGEGDEPSPESGLGENDGNPYETAASAPIEPSPESGHGPSPISGATESSLSDMVYKEEPVIEPVRERERRAREAQQEEGDRLLAELKAAHPQTAHDSPQAIADAWRGLGIADKREARARFGEWITARGKRTALANLSTYLRERRWKALPAPAADAAPSASCGSRFVNAFDRAWWRLLFEYLRAVDGLAMRGGAARAIYDRQVSAARARIGWKVDADRIEEVETRALGMVKAPVDGELFAAWSRAVAEARGVSLPVPDAVQWVFVPAGEPADWLAKDGVSP